MEPTYPKWSDNVAGRRSRLCVTESPAPVTEFLLDSDSDAGFADLSKRCFFGTKHVTGPKKLKSDHGLVVKILERYGGKQAEQESGRHFLGRLL